MRSRRAFTVIEMLLITVIIGILAAIAVIRFAATKDIAYTTQLKSDLRNIAVAQESYLYQHSTYAPNVALLAPYFVPSAQNTLTIVQATNTGWSATATGANTSVICALFFGVGAVAPATVNGQIACQ